MAATSVLALGLLGWFVYERYLHPAWRRQRRVRRACAKAFDEGEYQLECFRVSLGDPSAGDLFSISPFGSDGPSRYFTYKIRRYFTYKIRTVQGAEPDFSGMDSEEIRLVRHYLHRTLDVPHHGKEVLSPSANEHLANNQSRVPA